jgi:hypothetical protein
MIKGSVQWFLEQLQKTRDWQRVINEANQSTTSVRNVLQQAKEMEKERIINAWKAGDGKYDKVADKLAEQYYEQTYGGGEQ